MKLGFVWKDMRDLLARTIVDLKELFVLEREAPLEVKADSHAFSPKSNPDLSLSVINIVVNDTTNKLMDQLKIHYIYIFE